MSNWHKKKVHERVAKAIREIILGLKKNSSCCVNGEVLYSKAVKEYNIGDNPKIYQKSFRGFVKSHPDFGLKGSGREETLVLMGNSGITGISGNCGGGGIPGRTGAVRIPGRTGAVRIPGRTGAIRTTKRTGKNAGKGSAGTGRLTGTRTTVTSTATITRRRTGTGRVTTVKEDEKLEKLRKQVETDRKKLEREIKGIRNGMGEIKENMNNQMRNMEEKVMEMMGMFKLQMDKLIKAGHEATQQQQHNHQNRTRVRRRFSTGGGQDQEQTIFGPLYQSSHQSHKSIYDDERFVKVYSIYDRHASKFAGYSITNETSLRNVMKLLLDTSSLPRPKERFGLSEELEKVDEVIIQLRLICTFLSKRMTYEKVGWRWTMLQLLRERRCCCDGYSKLFVHLVEGFVMPLYQDIIKEVHYVWGITRERYEEAKETFRKFSTPNPPKLEKNDFYGAKSLHAWSSIKLFNCWFFVDCCWFSGDLSRHWFLQVPKKFICTHFGVSNIWDDVISNTDMKKFQRLEDNEALNITEFENKPKITTSGVETDMYIGNGCSRSVIFLLPHREEVVKISIPFYPERTVDPRRYRFIAQIVKYPSKTRTNESDIIAEGASNFPYLEMICKESKSFKSFQVHITLKERNRLNNCHMLKIIVIYGKLTPHREFFVGSRKPELALSFYLMESKNNEHHKNCSYSNMFDQLERGTNNESGDRRMSGVYERGSMDILSEELGDSLTSEDVKKLFAET